MTRTIWPIAAALAVAGIMLAVAACGSSGPPAAARYTSAGRVIAALDHGRLRCTGASYTTPPVVTGATSETSCNFSSSQSGFIDTFPGTITTAKVLRNSVSTGTQQIWSVVGPNWWVQASKGYARRIQKVLGGRIVAGPWHPEIATAPSPAPSPQAPQDPAAAVCQKFGAFQGNLTSILSSDVADPASLTPDSTLNGYGDRMSHWSYVISQAVDVGTTAAPVQFANDLGDAGLATVQVAEPLPAVVPDVQKAIGDVSAVESDCASLAG